MARRRLSQVEMSMFPFLSVLCAVIGILMLFMIVVITSRVIEPPEPPPPPPPFPPPPWSGAEDADEPGIADDLYASLERQVEELTGRLLQRRSECRELQTLCRQLEELIKEKGIEIALGGIDPVGGHPPLGAPEDVRLIPDPKQKVQVTKKPILIEVTLEGFTVHPEKARYPVEQLDQNDSPLRKYIASFDEQRQRQYMLLLVHPNGATTYTRLRRYLVEHYNKTQVIGRYRVTSSRIDLGKEPFSRDWLLVDEREKE